jgi:peroxiredoxin
MRYRLVLGSDDIAAAYGGVNELPATFVIDRSGVIVAHMVGALRSGQYDSLIAQLLQ